MVLYLFLDLGALLCYWDILYQKSVSVNPRSMNTDTVEWTFGDERQMAGGSHNKLTTLGFNRGVEKSNPFNVAKCRLVGNNKDGEILFQRKRKY